VSYPEIITTRAPHAMTISEEVRHQARTKVSGEVDGIASLPAKACADTEDDEEESERGQVTGAEVSVVLEGVDAEHQDCAGDELGEEHSSTSHE